MNRNWLALFLVLVASCFIFIPTVQAKSTAPIAKSALVDLNSASLAELNALPGVGAVKAQAIIDGRPYGSLDDFAAKGIVAKSAFDKFKDLVTVSGGSSKASTPKPASVAATGPVDLNSASVDALNALPGVGNVKAQAIIDGRPYASLSDFASKGIVSKSAYDKFKDLVTVSNSGATKKVSPPAATPPAAPGATASTSTGPVDLNTGSLGALVALPGIGAVSAKAILAGRPYKSKGDLVSKAIVSKSTFDKFKDLVTVSGSGATVDTSSTDAIPPEPVGLIDLNTASIDELESLPGIGVVKANAIINARPFASISDFVSKGILTKPIFDKLNGVVTVVPSAKSASSSTKTATTTSSGTPGQIAEHRRISMCGAKWRAAKAAGQIPAGQTWPKYWSLCNTELKQQGN